MLAGRSVVDIRCDECLQLPGQIGIQSLFERGWDFPASFDFIRAELSGAARRQVISRLPTCRFKEGVFSALHVLQFVIIGRLLRPYESLTNARRNSSCVLPRSS